MAQIDLISQLGCFVLIALFIFLIFKFRRLSGQGLASNYPIIGCLISFYRNRRRLLTWYTELLSQSKTQTIVVKRLGATRTIVTANPENVEYVLKTNFNNFPKGKPFTDILGDFLGRGIFNVDGAQWHVQRKIASHEFTVTSLRDYANRILKEEVEDRLLPVLEKMVGKVVDMQELLRRLAFDLVCRETLGFDPCLLDPDSDALPVNELGRAFDAASMICAMRGAAAMPLVWKVKRAFGIGSEGELKRAVKKIHDPVMEQIRVKKKLLGNGTGNGTDLLSRLISTGEDDDDELIRDTAISFIMAGRDTTSAAMTWLFWLLSRHRDEEKRILTEVGTTFDMNSNEHDLFDSMKEMRVLKACLCETMRLYPPVAWDSKHAVKGDTLPDGTVVQQGDRVTYFPYGMGRMEALWGEDWAEFKPDRWLVEPETLNRVSPYKYPVFQGGPRVCLGKEMAFVQMKYVVGSVLRRFELKRVGEEEKVFVPMLTAHMAGGFSVLVQRRQVES